LGIYHAGARLYDPEIGRFASQDRFKEKYPSMSPYQYAANNPILFIDVNGDSVIVQDDKQLQNTIEVLRSTETGNRIFEELDSNPNLFVFVFNNENLVDEDGTKVNGLTEPKSRKGDKAFEVHVFIDVIAANENGGNSPFTFGFQNSSGEGSAITLAHEFGHVQVAHESIRIYRLEARIDGGHDPRRPPIRNENAVRNELFILKNR